MDAYRRRPPRACDPDPALTTERALLTHLSLKYVLKKPDSF